MTLAQDFEDFVKLLNKHQVDYMVVGGYALAFHGKPRHTGDLDIWINSSETNAEKLVSAIKEFGLASLGLTKSDFMQEGFVTQIGYPPLRIDILNTIDGVNIGVDYPAPIVDVELTRKLASEKVWGLKKTTKVKVEAKRILKKHVNA